MASPPQPSRHWVIGDVHGCADSLLDLLRRIPTGDRLILCGDVINRGPQIERAMEVAWNLVSQGRAVWLRGNHEQGLLKALSKGSRPPGPELAGCETYRQLGDAPCRFWQTRLASLPLVYRGHGWTATHAGFDPITWKPDLSIRLPFWQAYDGRFGNVVIGHTPAPEVRSLNGITMIDTGACYGGSLTAYCPENGDLISVPGARVGRGSRAPVLAGPAPADPSRPC
jgi:serine/threonine protein phosphatase 1